MSRNFFAELQRRNVIRAAILYAGGVWAIAQGISQLAPSVGAPEWTTRWFLVAAAIGFPLWIAFAWFYEFTPEGLKRESEVERHESITHQTGRKLDFAIIGVLAVAVVLLLTDRFVLRHGVNQEGEIAISEKSIAVLPFVNMSDDKGNEYFSDGISEELLNVLAKVQQLHVAARTSSFSFKGKNAPIPEIAKTLLVANVLEGSVRKSGNEVRITAQLIRATDGYHVWSDTWDRNLDDIFKIQDEIAAKVVEELKVTLLGSAPKVRATNPEAYALYLQGNEVARPATVEAVDASDALYRRALELDPKYVPALDGLTRNAFNRVVIASHDEAQQKLGYAEVRKLADQAIAVDPDYAPTYGRLGGLALRCCDDVVGAARHFQHALALDSRDLNLLSNSTSVLIALGRFDQAAAVTEVLLRRDPVNVATRSKLAGIEQMAGRYDKSIENYRTVLTLLPTRYGIKKAIAQSMLLKGDAQAALPEFEREPDAEERLWYLSMVYHALGRNSESDAALHEFSAKYAADAAYQIAQAHAFRGEADEAYAWLEKAREQKDPGLIEVLQERFLDRIHNDPRWLPFLRKLGKDPETLSKIEFEVTLPKEWQAEATAETAAKPAATAH
jgi:TolB-like protein